MISRLVVAVLAFSLPTASLAMGQEGTGAAEVIFFNGKIATVNDNFDIVQAVAVRYGKIIGVGSDERVRRDFAGAATRFVDLKGRLTLPGFDGNHEHVNARRPPETDPGYVELAGIRNLTELQDAIRQKAATLPAGTWITGAIPTAQRPYRTGREVFREANRPTRWDLDEATRVHPVALYGGGVSTGIVNSLALEKAGITRFTPDPPSGAFERDSAGEPTGILRGSPAKGMIEAGRPPLESEPLPDSLALRLLRERLDELLAWGYTSINNPGVTVEHGAINTLRLLQLLYSQSGDSLPRMTVQIRLRPGYDNYDDLNQAVSDAIRELEGLQFVTGFGDDRLKLGAIKLSVDDGVTGLNAWMKRSFRKPDFYGAIRIPERALYPVAKRAHDLGWQLGIHVVGDAAIESTVRVYEQVLLENPRPDHRHYLHHFTIAPSDSVLQKVADLEILVALQPNFVWSLAPFVADAFPGDERLERFVLGQTLKQHGIQVSYGSDDVPTSPLVGIWAAVTRRGVDGQTYAPSERVSVADAIRYHTIGSAFLTFDEEKKGTLEVGKFADMVVLADDILTIPTDEILDVAVDMSIVGGKIVYRRLADDLAL